MAKEEKELTPVFCPLMKIRRCLFLSDSNEILQMNEQHLLQ